MSIILDSKRNEQCRYWFYDDVSFCICVPTHFRVDGMVGYPTLRVVSRSKLGVDPTLRKLFFETFLYFIEMFLKENLRIQQFLAKSILL